MIPDLQTGTRDDLKELEKGTILEGACYIILASLAYRWAGFQGSFGGKKDPSSIAEFDANYQYQLKRRLIGKPSDLQNFILFIELRSKGLRKGP